MSVPFERFADEVVATNDAPADHRPNGSSRRLRWRRSRQSQAPRWRRLQSICNNLLSVPCPLAEAGGINGSHPFVLGEPLAGIRTSTGNDGHVVAVRVGRIEIGVRVCIRISICIGICICSTVEIEDVSTRGRGSRTRPRSGCFGFSRFSLLCGPGLRRRRLFITLSTLFSRRRFSRSATDASGQPCSPGSLHAILTHLVCMTVTTEVIGTPYVRASNLLRLRTSSM